MSNKIKNNFLTTVILAVIVIALAVTISLVQQKTSFLPRAGNSLTIESIQNDNELNSVSDELDKTNLDDIDSVLKQNDSDLSNF
jgi:hypothetical protein